MTLDEFKDLIDTYGASPERWPGSTREDAQAFAALNSEMAAPILRGGAEVDEALDTFLSPEPSDLLRQRILQSAREPLQSSVPKAGAGGLRRRTAAALALFAFGAGFGGAQLLPSLGSLPEAAAPMQAEQTADDVWLEAASDLGVSDIYAWVEGEDSNSAAVDQ